MYKGKKAHEINLAEMLEYNWEDIRIIFEKYDRNKNNFLEQVELSTLLFDAGYSTRFEAEDGNIDNASWERYCRMIFDKYDANGDGFVTPLHN